MTYRVVRVKLGVWRDSFQDTEDDTNFDADSYPALDHYLSMMEERGWSVVNTSTGTSNSGTFCLYITLHRAGVPELAENLLSEYVSS